MSALELDLDRSLTAEKKTVERELRRLMNQRRGVPDRLLAAMKHSLLGGGKRLRPIILLWTYDALAGHGPQTPVSRDQALAAAGALEMIHTYSLIHDDLPAMDDDVLRRGRPTCHVAFDEATAILAGDGLQARAFEVLGQTGGAFAGPLVAMIAAAVGPAGMVGGQQEDLDAEGVEPSDSLVRSIHLKKTAALLAVAFGAGALLAGAGDDAVDRISRAGIQLGLAFQGADDVLDVTASTEELGKSPGKDAAAGKVTWIGIEGLEKARSRAERQGRRGRKGLEVVLPAGNPRELLLELGRLMWDRKR
nr:polyprenyl synthetase family protein [Candidatus Krumholzibacteria bacterium]